MALKTHHVDEDIYHYLVSVSLREPEILRRLQQESASQPDPNLQIGPDQVRFMALLVKILGAKKIIETGTHTGYSSLCRAMAMPEDGKLTA